MAGSHRRLLGLLILLAVLLVTFALTSGWRSRLLEQSARHRRFVAEVEKARAQHEAKAAEETRLEASLKIEPHDLEARLRLAHLRLTLRGAPAALIVLQAAEGRTEDPRLLRALAECYRLTRREDKTLALLNRASQLATSDGDVRVDQAMLFSLLLWFEEAEGALGEAERLRADPRQVALVRAMMAWQKGSYKQARETLQDALGKFPDDTPLLRQLAVVANSEGQYKTAAALLERVVRKGADVETLVMLTRLHVRRSETKSVDQAVATAQKALALRPRHGPARLQLARALRLQGKKEEARKILEGLLRDRPQTRGLSFELFEINRTQGRDTDAKAFLSQYREERGRRQAMSQAVTVLMAHPDRATAHRDMAARCLENKLYGRAILSALRALSLDPNVAGAKALLQQARDKAQKAMGK